MSNRLIRVVLMRRTGVRYFILLLERIRVLTTLVYSSFGEHTSLLSLKDLKGNYSALITPFRDSENIAFISAIILMRLRGLTLPFFS